MSERGSYERFLWFDQEVRKGKYPNASTLAEQFEFSTKTAQRDIEFMRDRLNAPLEYDQQKKGYYYADANFFLPFTHLSSSELSALLIARQMLKGIAAGDSLKGELSAAIGKITTILGKSIGGPLAVDESVSFELIEYAPVNEDVFARVLEACIQCRCIRFTYYSPAQDKQTQRIVEPYHLFNYMGTWHCIAHCRDKKDIRDFVLARMSDLVLLDEKFSCRKNFNAREHLQSAFGIFKGANRKKTEVTLRFSPKRAKWVKDQVWFKGQTVKTLKDGSFELTFPVTSFYEIVMEILKYGSDVEVIKPAELRRLIIEETNSMLAQYRKKETRG